MMETKEYILTNATQLLNRQGATATSLRQLAAYLDMSDGNLRYHFRNKEDLVMAIFEQMVQELKAANELADTTSVTFLEDARKQLRVLFFTMYRYKFLFLEANLLLKQFEGLRKAFQVLLEERKEFVERMYRSLKPSGILTHQLPHAQYELLFEQLFILSDNWIRYADLEQTKAASIDKKIDHYIELCLMLLGTVVAGNE
jgi:AcrR family transcriptional regulator